MPDRGKVIDELIMLKRFLPSTMWEPINDAIALLKQEAVKPIPYHRSDGTIFKYECRKCRTKIFKNDLFCRRCGQAVKWE